MRRHVVSVLFVASTLAACHNTSDPAGASTQLIAGAVVITLDKSIYTWDEASTNGVRGTVRNTSDRTVYSNVGDAFNSAVEQDPLLIAHLSDGAIERQTGADQWTRVETAVAIEGTRFVALQPGQQYHFIGQVAGAARTGTFRIGLTYRSTINDEERAATGTSYSASFEIR